MTTVCCERGVPVVGVLPARWTCPKCLREWVHVEDEAEGGYYVQADGGPWQTKPAFDEDRHG